MPPQANQAYENALRAILAHYASMAEDACLALAPAAIAPKLAQLLGSNADRDAESCAAANPLRRPVACVQGCCWCCCGTRVDLHAPEAILIAEHMRTLPYTRLSLLQQRVSEAALRFRSQTGAEIWLAQYRCALLDDDNTCSVYEVSARAIEADRRRRARNARKASNRGRG